jgi:hypothetical protein
VANLSCLPGNWRKLATPLSDLDAEWYKRQGPEKVWVDDDCPMSLRIIIVDENNNVFCLDDPAIVLLILRVINFTSEITEMYGMTRVPIAVCGSANTN